MIIDHAYNGMCEHGLMNCQHQISRLAPQDLLFDNSLRPCSESKTISELFPGLILYSRALFSYINLFSAVYFHSHCTFKGKNILSMLYRVNILSHTDYNNICIPSVLAMFSRIRSVLIVLVFVSYNFFLQNQNHFS